MTILTEAGRLLGFAALAILTNTAFPYPFEPVLLLFAEGAGRGEVLLLSGIASVAAGVAALIDYHLLGMLRSKLLTKGVRDFHRWWFYGAVFAAALLPIPYTATRAALLRGRPNAALFAATVTLARFPRYLLTIHVWHVVSPPPWVTVVVVVLGVVVAAHGLRKRRGVSRQAVPTDGETQREPARPDSPLRVSEFGPPSPWPRASARRTASDDPQGSSLDCGPTTPLGSTAVG